VLHVRPGSLRQNFFSCGRRYSRRRANGVLGRIRAILFYWDQNDRTGSFFDQDDSGFRSYVRCGARRRGSYRAALFARPGRHFTDWVPVSSVVNVLHPRSIVTVCYIWTDVRRSIFFLVRVSRPEARQDQLDRFEQIGMVFVAYIGGPLAWPG